MKEIFEALLAGKKIRSEEWPDNEYIYLDDKGELIDEKGNLAIDVIFNDSMLIYKEPKKKVELFLWATLGVQGSYTTLNNNFMTEEEAKLIIGKDAIKTNISITVEV